MRSRHPGYLGADPYDRSLEVYLRHRDQPDEEDDEEEDEGDKDKDKEEVEDDGDDSEDEGYFVSFAGCGGRLD